jgi:hypothetical protein
MSERSLQAGEHGLRGMGAGRFAEIVAVVNGRRMEGKRK